MDKLHIILIPFYGAKPFQLQRHKAFFNKNNYPVTIVKLSQTWTPYIGKNKKFGMKSKWTDEIVEAIDQVPGAKVLFAFSNPGASAIEAITRRPNSAILGLICDSGPSGDFYPSVLGLLKHHIKFKSVLVRFVLSILFYYIWSPGWNKQIISDVAKLKDHFPILSIQSSHDLLISIEQINKVFNQKTQLQLEKLILPDTGHLMGLKQHPELYQKTVLTFLTALKNIP